MIDFSFIEAFGTVIFILLLFASLVQIPLIIWIVGFITLAFIGFIKNAK